MGANTRRAEGGPGVSNTSSSRSGAVVACRLAISGMGENHSPVTEPGGAREISRGIVCAPVQPAPVIGFRVKVKVKFRVRFRV